MTPAEKPAVGGKPVVNKGRTNARLAAVQALYQMESTAIGVEAVIEEFCAHRLGGDIEGAPLHKADQPYFAALLRGVVEAQARIDPYIEGKLTKNWKLSRLDSTVRAILRAGLFELASRNDTPPRVIIDEYVEIANAFFDGEEPAFINGVLDAGARAARAGELEEAGIDEAGVDDGR